MALTLSGGTALNLGNATAGSGIFVTANAANSITIQVILNSAATAIAFSNNGTGLLTIFGGVTGAATTGSQTITVGASNSGNITLSGNLTDGGLGGKVALAVNNTGSGITSMNTGTYTYTGDVTLSAGVLLIASTGSVTTLGSGASALSLNGGELWLRANGARTYGRDTTVGGNVTITVDRSTVPVANAGYTLGNLTIGAQTLTVALGATESSGIMTFGNVTMTGASTFTVNNANQLLSISGTFANGGFTPTFNGTGNVTLTGIVSGSGGLTEAGSGNLLLIGDNTYNGTTTVSAGTLAINSSGRIANTSNLLVNGGTFNLGAFNETVGTVTMSSGSIGGSGNLTGTSYALQGGTVNAILGGSGAVTVSGNTTTLGSAGRLGSGKALTISGGQLTIAGAESVASYQQTGGTLGGTGNTLTSTAAYDLQAGTVNANLGGSIGVNKTTAGTLFVNGSLAAASAVIVNAGTLGGNGTIGGSLTVNSGGTLAPGNSPGIITVGTLVLNAGSTTVLEINAATSRGTSFDGIDITATTGTTLTYGGNLTFSFGNGAPFANSSTLDLFNFTTGTFASNFANVTSTGTLYSGTWTNNSGTWSLSSGGQTLNFAQATGDLSVVPEPGTWALLAFSLTTALVFRRRRRRCQ